MNITSHKSHSSGMKVLVAAMLMAATAVVAAPKAQAGLLGDIVKEVAPGVGAGAVINGIGKALDGGTIEDVLAGSFQGGLDGLYLELGIDPTNFGPVFSQSPVITGAAGGTCSQRLAESERLLSQLNAEIGTNKLSLPNQGLAAVATANRIDEFLNPCPSADPRRLTIGRQADELRDWGDEVYQRTRAN